MRGDKHSSCPQWIHSLLGERLLRCCPTPGALPHGVLCAQAPTIVHQVGLGDRCSGVYSKNWSTLFLPLWLHILTWFSAFFFISSFMHLRLPYVIDPKSLSLAQVSFWSSRHLDFTALMPPLTACPIHDSRSLAILYSLSCHTELFLCLLHSCFLIILCLCICFS